MQAHPIHLGPRTDIHTYLHFFKRLFPSVHWLWQVQTIEEGHILATSPESDLLEVGMGGEILGQGGHACFRSVFGNFHPSPR